MKKTVEKKMTAADLVKLPDLEMTKRKIAARLLENATRYDDVSYVKEVAKILNLNPYQNTELDDALKCRDGQKHAAIMKLYAQNKITAEQVQVFDKLITHKIDINVVKTFDERLKQLEKKKR